MQLRVVGLAVLLAAAMGLICQQVILFTYQAVIRPPGTNDPTNYLMFLAGRVVQFWSVGDLWPRAGIYVVLAVTAYGAVCPLWFFRGRAKIAPALMASIAALCVVAYIGQVTEWRQDLATRQLIWRIGILFPALTASGFFALKASKLFHANLEASHQSKVAAQPSRRGRSHFGFTMVEVLVAVAIIVVLSAITATVLIGARSRGRVAVEVSQLKQLYYAANLYEADYDHVSPRSLARLVPSYIPPKMLRCDSDVRTTLGLKDWPANPWAWMAAIPQIQKPPADAYERIPYLNSYVYLKTYDGLLANHTFTELRDNPTIGFITGIGLLNCFHPLNSNSLNGCDYYVRDYQQTAGQPPTNLVGTFATVRTDGSVEIRKRPEECSGSILGPRELFFMANDCKQKTSVSPG